jgi:photosystem II stability/assembly factor-like uncharacterized protein
MTTRGYIVSHFYRFASYLASSAVALSSIALATESTNTWYLRGPDGGYTDTVALDSGGQLLTGGGSGLFRYDAVANSWKYANSGMPTPGVSEIAKLSGATVVNSSGNLARLLDVDLANDANAGWSNLSGGALVAGQVLSIATAAPSRVFAAGDPMGLARSDDKGATWASIGPAMSANLVRVSPTNPNLVFVGNTAGQLLISTDGGATFPNLIQSNVAKAPQFFDVAQDPFNAPHLIAVAATGVCCNGDTGGEVWVSNDAGTNWSVSTDNFVFAPEITAGAEPRSVLFDAVTQNVVYFATTLGVFKSSSGGTSPAVSSAGMAPMGARPSGAIPYDGVDKLAKSTNGSILYAATANSGVYQSTDQAASWTPLSTGYQGLIMRILAFQPGTSIVLAGSSGQPGISGIYRSTDGGTTWAPSSSGMNSSGIRGIAFAPAPNTNIVLATGGAQQRIGGEFNKGVWRSTDSGVHWTSITSGLSQEYKRIVLFDPNDANHAMMSSDTISVSADAGLTWANSSTGLPTEVAGNTVELLGIAVGPGLTLGTTRFYAAFEDYKPSTRPPPPGAEGGVYYSDDGGNTWTASATPANGGLPDQSAAYFSVSPTSGTLYLSKLDLGVGRASGVFKSTDYGVHWQNINNNLTCTSDVFGLAADQADPNVVWAGCVGGAGGLFRSNDGGASWMPYDRGLRNKGIFWLSIDPAHSNNILAGGAEGVDQMNYAPDADQDGIPDSEEQAAAGTGDANNDGIPDYTQANVASTSTLAGPLAPSARQVVATTSDYVVVELDQTAAHTGTCQFVSDLDVVASDQIPLSKRMVQVAPAIRFVLPNCQSATVKIRYSANTSYPVGIFGSYSPTVPGDATTQAWGLFSPSIASVDGNGVWTLQLDQNAYGNVFGPNAGSIEFQGAPGKDSIFGNGFD